MVRNREWKMVVLLATALALGVGAVAACVVPWFYCKPPDADDDSRETIGTRNRTDPGSHFQSVVEETSTPAPNVRITGISYVRFVVPATPSSSFVSAMSTSATQNSAMLNAFSNENPVIVDVCHLRSPDLVQSRNVKTDVKAIQPPLNTDPMTSGLINSESIQRDRKTQGSTGNFANSKIPASELEAPQSSGSTSGNSGVSDSGLIDPSTLRVKVTIKNNDNTSGTLPVSETSDPTDESSTEPTTRTLSSTSATESRNTTALTASSACLESSALTSSTKTEQTSSTIPTTSDPSNPTDESSAEASNTTASSRLSAKSSSGPTRVATKVVIESTKMSDPLETIREVSTSPAPSFEPSPKFSRRLKHGSSGIDRTPNVWFGNESSITSTSTRASYRKTVHPFPSDITAFLPVKPSNPDTTESTSMNHPDVEAKKTSKSSRYPLFGHIRKFLRGIKTDTTPRSGRSKSDQESHTDSVRSFSAEKKLPTGHSTLMPEEDRLLEFIRTRRSPKTLPTCTSQVFEDPVGLNNGNLHWVPQFGAELDEEPLDLSIRSSSDERGNAKAGDTSTRRRSSAESCKQMFREVAEYLKVRKSSRSSEEGVSRSDSLTFCGDVSGIRAKDENQNLTSELSNVGSVKVEEAGSFRRDSDAGELDRSCLPKSNGLPRRIKKILRIGGKDRGKGNKILTSVPKGPVLNSGPGEFQRNSAGTSSRLKSELSAKVDNSPDSSTDVTSFYELGINKSDNDRLHRDVPCTEL